MKKIFFSSCLPLLKDLLRRRQFRIGICCTVSFLTVLGNFEVSAQDSLMVERDTVVVDQPDTVAIQSYAKRYSPRKAILYAAVLPGLGQVYNKKYWKLPLVYGGFYFIGFYIDKYNDIYTEYKGYLFYNLENGYAGENDEPPDSEIGLTTGQLRTIVDKARRERDFMIILMGGMYLLQMVDAHVDSHLKEFDLNPNLQVRIEPTIQNDAWAGRTAGLALVFKF
jgi:hypothetical protein